MQKIREPLNKNLNQYGADYNELSVLKTIADNHGICILLVHHIRKLTDSKDPVNEVSGSTGITGTVDTILVLKKDTRFSDTAVLYVSGRDVEQQQMTLKFEDTLWHLIDCKGKEEIQKEQVPDFLFRLVDYMKDKTNWTGSATELLISLNESDIKPNIASKYLSQYCYDVLQANGIDFTTSRTGKGRTITLKTA